MTGLLAGMAFLAMTLNCENAFDCRHDEGHDDYQFLPDGERRWTPGKYWGKLRGIAKTIVSATDDCGRLPDLVALQEVENDSVVFDLTRRSLLRNACYKYVVTSSPDVRGIDVALLYDPGSFKLLSSYPLRVTPLPGMRPTRDILYASGSLLSGDTVHVFVVHTPSRYGGARRTMPYRRLVTDRLMLSIDSVRRQTRSPRIIVMGDFNEEAHESSLKNLVSRGLVDAVPAIGKADKARGTYRYKGRWQQIDHILMSHALAEKMRYCRVMCRDFLIKEDDTYGGYSPLRTFNGFRYEGGVSDHLPLVACFEF